MILNNPIRWAIIIFLGLLIYGQTFQYDFVFDDHMFILYNPVIKDLSQVHLIWHSYPMTRSLGFFSFALNYALGGFSPIGYHVFNLIVHFIAVGLVWALAGLLFRITKISLVGASKELPFIIAVLFLVHPCQTQAVSYISQRFESMATIFYLGAMYSYLSARVSTQIGNRALLFGLSGLLTILGILTKEVVITVPAMMLASEWILFPKKTNPRPYIIVSIAAILLYLLFTKLVYTDLSIFLRPAVSLSHDGDILTPSHYLLTQLRVFLTFLRLLVLPIHQNLDYDYPASTGLLQPPLTLLGAVGIIGIITLIFKLRRSYPLISFGLAWVLITFSINLAPRANVIFEHKLYLISFGFFLAFVMTMNELIKDRKILMRVFACLIMVLSLVSFQRNKIWKDEISLWSDIVQKSPHKARGYINLALAYKAKGDLPQAMSAYDQAIEAEPDFADAYYNRGLEYYRQGDLVRAFADFNKVIAINPVYAEAYNNRGLVYFYRGDLGRALADDDKAIAINPGYGAALINRAIIYYSSKEYDKAWADVRQAQVAGSAPNPAFISALEQASR